MKIKIRYCIKLVICAIIVIVTMKIAQNSIEWSSVINYRGMVIICGCLANILVWTY